MAGFYGFFALFVGLFTKLGLWAMLNVAYPKDDVELLSTVSLIAFAVAVMCFAYAIHQHRKDSVRFVAAPLLAFFVAASIALTPWFAKNIREGIEQKVPLSVSVLISGVLFPSPADVSSLRTPEENAAISKAKENAAMSASGKTTNEDLGRYFGYENGINNHLKLPFNLTYQRNQPGEYTEITFIFLALLPAVFVFLAFRHPAFALAPVAVFLFEYFYFWNPRTSVILTEFFSNVSLPGGYFVIAAITLLPLA
ncbi:MAG: hypothetical protein QG650_14 [Patescibacteria group bacterium]|nr:hypothetical protein [Patescibacteria group bacterium]